MMVELMVDQMVNDGSSMVNDVYFTVKNHGSQWLIMLENQCGYWLIMVKDG